jgi:hypothetical protein
MLLVVGANGETLQANKDVHGSAVLVVPDDVLKR